ncbi:MAG TPA: hypothetical protein VD978_10140 [Azospirillum sp.]|nr:hypothetical protein [Azospirillum sp.]
MATVSSTPPSTFLYGAGVTDLNRQTIWDSLDAATQSKYTSGTSNTSTSGSTGSTGSTGTSGGSSTTTPTSTSKFSSLGSQTALNPASFDGRTDTTRSATPTNGTLTGFSKLWSGDAALQAQLSTTPPKGGAIFVNIQKGTAADGTRPEDGRSGNIENGRGKNPYGYFDADNNFVQIRRSLDGQETEVTYNPDSGIKREDWLKTAKREYDAYEALITKQMNAVTSSFGSQGLLGYDVNNNGYIDNESELFGFDNGLDINGSAYIMQEDATKVSFTFLSGATPADGESETRRLTGDPLDPNGDSTQKENYRRFMVLTSSGESVSVLQSEIGYDEVTRSYVKAQTVLQFGASGATLTGIAQSGLTVSQVV